MDAACLPALAVIGAAALPLPLAEQYARLERGELDELAAASVRAQLRAVASVLPGWDAARQGAPVSSTDQVRAPAIPSMVIL